MGFGHPCPAHNVKRIHYLQHPPGQMGTSLGSQRPYAQPGKTPAKTRRARPNLEIHALLIQYVEICNKNLGTEKSRDTYVRYVRMFVRRINDDFTPGTTRLTSRN